MASGFLPLAFNAFENYDFQMLTKATLPWVDIVPPSPTGSGAVDKKTGKPFGRLQAARRVRGMDAPNQAFCGCNPSCRSGEIGRHATLRG